MSDTDWLKTGGRSAPVPAWRLRSLLYDLHPAIEEFTPEYTTLDPGSGQPFSLPENATIADEAGLWGAASYGWFATSGDFVDYSLRMILGTMIDAAFNPGEGYAAIELPVPAASFAAPAGVGWIVGMTEAFATVKMSTHIILDPVFSTDAALIGVDGLTTASSFDPMNDPPPWAAIAPDYPVAMDGPLLFVIAAGRYRKA